MKKEIFLDIRKLANVKIGLGNVIEYANPYILDILQYNLTEFVTQKPKIICHQDMPDIIHDTIAGFIMNYEEGIAVLKHKAKNNDYFWALTHFKPSYNPDGSFRAFITLRKPLPDKKITGEMEDMKYQIAKLYEILKGIEQHIDKEAAQKYLDNFLEYKGFKTLKDYYMSFFNFKNKELENYFAIDEKTPKKVIKQYINLVSLLS